MCQEAQEREGGGGGGITGGGEHQHERVLRLQCVQLWKHD